MFSNVLRLTTVNSIQPILSWVSTDSSILSSTLGTWSSTMPITATTYKWLSSSDNINWTITNRISAFEDFFDCNNTYIKVLVSAVTSIITLTADSNVIYTDNITQRATVLLLNADTISPVAKNIFVDNSSTKSTILRIGTPSQGTFTPFSASLSGSGIAYDPDIHGGSAYFDGSGDYVSVQTSRQVLPFAESWTIECWINKTANNGSYSGYSASCIASTGNGTSGFEWIIGGSGAGSSLSIKFKGSSSLSVAYSFELNRWYHVAAVKDGTKLSLFIDGIEMGNNTSLTSWTDRNILSIGSLRATPYYYYFPGYISDVRVVNGTALYPTNPVPTTPLTNIANTSVLVNFTNGSVLDSVGKTTLLMTGNVDVTNSVKKFGTGSLYFDGVGDNLTIQDTTKISSAFSASAFTIEAWINVVSFGLNNPIFSITGANAAYFKILGLNVLTSRAIQVNLRAANGNSDASMKFLTSPINTVVLNQWHHVALVVDGTAGTLYVDGSSVATSSTFYTEAYNVATGTNYIKIGAVANGYDSNMFSGYMDDFRITNGVARYPTQAFPTAILPNTSSGDVNFDKVSLLLQADITMPLVKDTFLDSSSNSLPLIKTGAPSQGTFTPFSSLIATTQTAYNPAIHGGSSYFDGNYTSTPNISLFDFSSGNDFTIEFWANADSSASLNHIFSNEKIGSRSIVCYLLNNTLVWNLYKTNNVSTPDVCSITSVEYNANEWNHFALVKSGSIYSVYVNGIGTSVTGAGYPQYDTTTQFAIGGRPHNSSYFTGYLSDFRVVNGTAVYTGSTIAVPTAPLTNIPNTSLLLNFTNGGVLDSTGKNDVLSVEDAKVTNYISKYGAGCLTFDGFNNLQILSSPKYNFNAGFFTVECWIYFKSVTNCALITNYQNVGGAGWGIHLNSSKIVAHLDGYYGDTITGVTTINVGIWYHVALSVSPNSCKLFVNGIQEGLTFTSSIGSSNLIERPITIGCQVNRAYFNGYMDDLRIIKGVCYKNNFSPGPGPLIYL